jgi:ABC-type glycerol-3-phosphate transport system permease component
MSDTTERLPRIGLIDVAPSVRRVVGEVAFYVLAAAIVLIALFPFYWILITSLKTDAEFNQGTQSLLPTAFHLDVYADLFARNNFLVPLVNSALVALCTTLISLLVGVLAAYAMVRLVPGARAGVLGFILAVGFFPVIAMVGPLFFLFRSTELLNNYLSLIVSYLIYALPINVWILVSIFSQIPKDMEEAGMVDGATKLQVLWRILLPVAIPGVFTSAILSFILSWNDYLFALSFMTDPDKFTAPLAIANLGQSQYHVFFNVIDAGVVTTTVPIVILVLIAQRRIVAGLAAGGLKGT